MSSDEEYLDSLLKSIMGDEETSNSPSEEAAEAALDNETAPETETAPDAEILSEAEAAPDTEALSEAEAAPDTEALSEAEAAPDTEILSEAEAAPDTEALSEAEAAPDTEALSEAEAAPDTEVLPEAEASPNIEALLDDFAIQDFGEEEFPEYNGETETEETRTEEAESEEAESEEAVETGDIIEAGEASMDDFAIQDFGEEEFPEDSAETQTEEAQMQEAQAGEAQMREAGPEGFGESEETVPDDMDELEALLKAVNETASEPEAEAQEEQPFKQEDGDDMDDELAEISGLLKQSEDGSMTDDDMLALLESMSMDSDGSTEESEEGTAEPEPSGVTEPGEEAEQDSGEDGKKKKKKKRTGFPGRKKKKKEASETDGEVDPEEVEWVDLEGEQGFDLPEAPKKNFFTRVLSFLTEADEEAEAKPGADQGLEPSDENRNILEELDEEDKKKKKKKIKGKNGKKKEAEETDEDGEEDEAAGTPEKKPKKKKEKKPRSSEEAPEREKKPGEKVSPRNIGVITGLSLTLAAVIVVLSSIVPAFFDKRNARDAYYKADYSKSFELLYGKKLDNSDTIIYNKSRIILQMNRKLDSWHNYVSLGKEVEALDALMSGVERYPSIYAEAEEYHVTGEVQAVYETILTLLADRFGISEEQAKEIIAYDDLAYTMKLESVVYGTPFEMPVSGGQDLTAPVVTQQENRTDLLAEEQELAGPGITEAESVETQTQAEQAELPGGQAQEASEPQAQPVEPQPEEEQPIPALSAEDPASGESGTQERTAETDNAQEQGASYGSQGQLIQGIQQPVEIRINP